MEFIKYNNNPKHKRTGDCVIRAIALACNLSWEKVYMDLAQLGCKKGFMINDNKNWQLYLKNLRYSKQKMPRKPNNKKYTVKEFADILADEDCTYIINIAKHLTVVKNKKLFDTWDCSGKCVGNYWII